MVLMALQYHNGPGHPEASAMTKGFDCIIEPEATIKHTMFKTMFGIRDKYAFGRN
jgi:hypothetical protein